MRKIIINLIIFVLFFTSQPILAASNGAALEYIKAGKSLGVRTKIAPEALTINGTMALTKLSSKPNATAGYGKVYVNGNNLYYNNGGSLTFLVSNGSVSAGNAGTLDGIDSLSFLRSDASTTYSSGTFTANSGTTIDINSTNVSIADTDISFDGASTTFTQTTGAMTMAPANGSNMNVNLFGVSDFVVGTNKFIVNNNGRVAIGHISPDMVLDINGGAALRNINDGTVSSGGGPVTFRSFTFVNKANGVSLTINKPSGTVDGDLIIAYHFSIGAGDSHDTPAGWTLITTAGKVHGFNSTWDTHLSAWYKTASGEPSSYNFTGTGDVPREVHLLRYDGHNSSNPINIAAINNGITSSSIANTVSVTTTVANTKIVKLMGVGVWPLQGYGNFPVGYTDRSRGSLDSIVFDKDQAAIGASDSNTLEYVDDGVGWGGVRYAGITFAIEPSAGSSSSLMGDPDNGSGFFYLSNGGAADAGIGDFFAKIRENSVTKTIKIIDFATGKLAASSNSDTLDNIDSTSFLRSDVSTTYSSGTFTVNSGTTIDINSTNVSIADTDISLDGASTTFTQTTGAMTMAPANGSNMNVNLLGVSDFVVDTNKLVVNNNGNVGIGYVNPLYSLAVNGTSFSKAFNINGNTLSTASLSQGSLLVAKSAGNIKELAKGTNHYALKVNGNALAWEVDAGSAGLGASNIDGLSDAKADVYSVYLGNGSGLAHSGNARNTGLGISALRRANSANTFNTAMGYQTMNGTTSGTYNTAVGTQALYTNATNSYNSAIGSNALYSNTANFNNALGSSALYTNSTGTYNTAIGSSALYENTTGGSNVAIGGNTLQHNQTGSYNVAIGTLAGGTGSVMVSGPTSYTSGTFIGHQSGYNNTTGNYNTAAGYQSLFSNTNGQYNTALGLEALYNNTSQSNSTAVGYNAAFNSTVSDTTALGANALYSNTTGRYNTALGQSALYNTVTGGRNTAVGYGAGSGFATNSFANGTLLGYEAGYNLTTGSNNIILGYQAGDSMTSGGKNIVIGYDIDAPSDTGSGQLTIGNLIYGTGMTANGTTVSGGKVGINKAVPVYTLDVNGTTSSKNFNINGNTLSTAPLSQGSLLVAKSAGNIKELAKGTNHYALKVNGNTLAWEAINVSGADAGTLDGIDSTEFLRANASTTYSSGTFTANSGTTIDINSTAVSIADPDISFDSASGVTFTPTAGQNLNVALSTTGDFAVNTNQLYVDTSAANVGIKIVSPSEKLTVNGNLALREGSAPSNTANYGKFYINSSNSKPYFLDDSGTSYNLTNGSASYWSLAGSNLYPSVSTYNTALGHSSPDTVLDLNGALTLRRLATSVFASSDQTSNGAVASTLYINKPSATVQNDLLIMAVSSTYPVSTGPSGWTLIEQVDPPSGNPESLTVYYKIATGSEPSKYSLVLSSAIQSRGVILRYTNVDTGSPIDAHASNYDWASGTIVTPDISTSHANTKILRIGALAVMTNTFDSLAGYNLQYKYETSSSDSNIVVFDKDQSGTGSIGTANITYTGTSMVYYSAVTLAINSANNAGGSADPSNPDAGSSVLWMANASSSSGKNGDLLTKVSAAGTTKTIRIIDFANGKLATTSADTVDGIDSLSFLRSDASTTYSSGTFTVNSGTTVDINSTNVSIADTDITLDGANTAFTQSSGNISLVPASAKDLTVTVASGGEFKINTNDLIFNGTNARLGIKKSNPGYTLDVNGITFSKTFNINGNTLTIPSLGQGSLLFAKSAGTLKELAKGTNHYALKVNGNALAWEAINVSGADAGTLDGIDSTEFLRANASTTYSSGTFTANSGTTIDINSTAVSIADPDISFDSASGVTFTPTAGQNLNVALSTTGDFAVNTNQLYVDTSAANVGIKIVSPSEKLTVNGNLALREGSAPSNTANYGKFYVSSSNSKPYFLDDSGTSYSLTNGAVASPWTLSGSNIYTNNDSYNVGIGTTAPDINLDIDGAVGLRETYDGNGVGPGVNFESSANSGFITMGTSASVAKPSGTVDGDLLIGFMSGSGSNIHYSAPGGWTLIGMVSRDGSGIRVQAWYKIASSEPSSYNFTSSSANYIYANILRYSGADTSNPIHVYATTNGEVSSSTMNTAAVVTTVENTKIIKYGAVEYISAAPGTVSGYTSRDSGNSNSHHSFRVCDKDQALTGTSDTNTMSSTGSYSYAEMTIAIAPASTGMTAFGTPDNGAAFFYLSNGSLAGANAGDLYIKIKENSTVKSVKIVDYVNGKVASSSSADTVDGIDSASFLRSDASTTYSSGTFTVNSGTTVDINSTNVSIADTDITLDGANTAFTQSSGNISLVPASAKDLTVTVASGGEFKINTNDLIFNGTNARLGIKKSNPGYTLDVNGITFSKTFNINGNTLTIPSLGQGSLLFAKSTGTLKELAKGTNHYALKVNGNALAWEPLASGGGATNLDDLTDAVSTSNVLFVGIGAGASSSGSSNTGVGYNALYRAAGAYNLGVGPSALYSNGNASGSANIAFGYFSQYNNYTGSDNISAGMYSLYMNKTGSRNLALGTGALYNNLVSNGIALGDSAANSNTTGPSNIAIGRYTLYYNATGGRNTMIGDHAGYGSNSYNFSNGVALGYNAGYSLTTGSSNILLGFQAGDAITSGKKNIVIGYDIDAPSSSSDGQLTIGNLIFGNGMTASTGTTVASGKVGIRKSQPAYTLDVNGTTFSKTFNINGNTLMIPSLGQGSLLFARSAGNIKELAKGSNHYVLKVNGNALAWEAASAGGGGGATNIDGLSDAIANTYSVFLGNGAGLNNASSAYNVVVGANAYSTANSGGYNVALGNMAMSNRASGSYNIAIGGGAMTSNGYASGNSNIAVGYYSQANNYNGNDNFSAGYYALNSNKSGSNNIAIGYQTLYSNTVGNGIALGYNSLYSNTTGRNNIGLGNSSLYYNVTGTRNTALGHFAGYGASSNSFSNGTLLGYNAGYSLTTGSNNILLGFQAGDAMTSGKKNIVIGYDIDAPSNTATGQLTIGNLIFGNGMTASTGTTVAGGKVGINKGQPAYTLDVNGTTFSKTFSSKVYSINGNTLSIPSLGQGSLLFARSAGNINELTKGSNHYVLKVNGNALAWEASSGGGGGTPGGANTYVQYNSSGSFAGSSNFAWNNGSNRLTVTGQILVSNGTTDEPGLRFISSNTGISSSNPSSNIKLVVQGNVPMHINSSNVGIGTSSVDTKLEVNGATMSNSFLEKAFYSNTSSYSVTIDWNNGNKQKITLAHNLTFTFTAPTTGVGSFTLILTQDGTGSRTVTWPASVKWPGGTAPTLSTAPGYIDVVTCLYDVGPVYYCQIGLDFR